MQWRNNVHQFCIALLGALLCGLFLTANASASAKEEPISQDTKITQTVKLYEGVLAFPAPIWVHKKEELKNINIAQRQNGNVFSLEQIPKDQEFESWKNLYGIYGFYLPEYDMKRFLNESLNALAMGCKVQAKSKLVSAENGALVMTYFCSDLADALVVDGYNTESGFLYLSQVDKSFAKVYMAWRAKKETMQTDKWPMNEDTVRQAIQRLQQVRYFSPE